ncbi:MAG: class I SAM-dependent methyltransferase [Candidatus Promineifilaceae bacterium]
MFEQSYFESQSDEQATIRAWFNETYRTKGFRYLRPPAAYKVYPRLLKLKKGESALDVACGLGLMLEQSIKVGANAYGIDLSDTAVGMAREYVPQAKIEVANSEHLPFEDGSMDAITCLGSLERMINLPRVFAEMQRVTRPDARFCFLVRNSQTLFWQLFMKRFGMQNKNSHQGAKNLEEWAALFDQHGFVIEKVLPDQWPMVRWPQAVSLGLVQRNPYRVRPGLRPVRYADELIFLLRKKRGAETPRG